MAAFLGRHGLYRLPRDNLAVSFQDPVTQRLSSASCAGPNHLPSSSLPSDNTFFLS
jgi:hypothetical protein